MTTSTSTSSGLAPAYDFIDPARRPILEMFLMLCPPAQRQFDAGDVKTAFETLKAAHIYPKQIDKDTFLDEILAGLPYDYHY